MMGIGNAITSTPQIAHIEPTHLPKNVVGEISPYPTVVIVMMAHQKVSGILPKSVSGSSFSQKYNKLERFVKL